MTEDEALTVLASISNATRLRTLRMLVAAGPEGMPAGAIADALGATPSRASFHLAKLTEAGLITPEREARQIRFRVDFDAMGALVRYLIEDCCNNNPTVRNCCVPGSRDRGGL